MIKFCVQQWDKHRERLKKQLSERTDLLSCTYKTLVELVVEYIFNEEEESFLYDTWDKDAITEIDNGDYQGTLLFIIPRKTYQPNESEYLMTFVDYGSCSGCDTLLNLQERFWYDRSERLTGSKLEGFMTLCKDIVQNTIKPYNTGWRNNELYDTVEVEK